MQQVKKSAKQRVLVVIPYGGEANPYAENYIHGAIETKQAETQRFNVIGAITDDARNIGVKTMYEGGYDWLLYLDADMIHAKGMLDRFLTLIKKNPDIKVISGVYVSKFTGVFCVYKWNEKEDCFYNVNNKADSNFKLNNGIYEAEAIGTGCSLWNREVFDGFTEPWFHYDYIERNEETIRCSEDMVFCKKILNKYKIYVDTHTVCGHIIPMMALPVDGEVFAYVRLLDAAQLKWMEARKNDSK